MGETFTSDRVGRARRLWRQTRRVCATTRFPIEICLAQVPGLLAYWQRTVFRRVVIASSLRVVLGWTSAYTHNISNLLRKSAFCFPLLPPETRKPQIMAPSTAAQAGAGGSASGATPGASTSTTRSRPQGSRKKINTDDAAYHAPPSASAAGAKRAAAERAEGEPRAKRKRVDTSAAAAATSSNGGGSIGGGGSLHSQKKDQANGEGKINLVRPSSHPPCPLAP